MKASQRATAAVKKVRWRGYLTKLGNVVKNWKKRYFELANEDNKTMLYYFKTLEGNETLKNICFFELDDQRMI